MDKKMEALLNTGKLEIALGEDKLVDDVKIIQKCIVEDDIKNVELAISLGKISSRVHNDENLRNCVESIVKYVSDYETDERIKKNRMFLEEIGLSEKSFNILRWVGYYIVSDILAMNIEAACNQIGYETFKEVVDVMEKLEFTEWVYKSKHCLKKYEKMNHIF